MDKNYQNHEPKAEIESMKRLAFYDRTRKAYVFLATGESALYANIILRKGVIVE